jgi:hypothetical protein
MRMTSPARRRAALAVAAAAALLPAAALTGLLPTGPAAGAGTGCQVGYQLQAWSGGFTANLTISVGATAVDGWRLTWTYPAGQQVTSAWNATVGQSGTAVTATNAAYDAQVPAGGSVQFGVQGTAGTSNPAPTDFALNGTPCNGSGPSGGPSTGPTPDTGPSGGPSTSPSGTGQPSTSPTPSTGPSTGAGCGGAALCDGFENQTGATPGGLWSTVYPNCQGTGTASIDTTIAHSGTRSLRVDGGSTYCNHVFVRPSIDVTGVGPVWYARFWVRHTTALPTSHIAFVALRDANDGGNDLRMGGQNGALQWNRQSDDATLPAQSPAGVAQSVPLPTTAWSCVEFMVNGAQGTMQTWVNGTEVPGLHEDGVPTPDIDQQWLNRSTWRPALTDFRLGWESYADGADTLWFDDVALGSARIGC